MLGSDLMMAPVVAKGEKKRDVYLPPGDWINLFNGTQTSIPPSEVSEG